MSHIADAASRRFNVKRYKPVLFALGNQVAVEDCQHASGGKLRAKYNGPFVIKQILPNERYLLAKKGQKTTVAAMAGRKHRIASVRRSEAAPRSGLPC
jgi:hypothetical protein